MQELANTAWVLATASESDAQVFAALARAAERRLGDFNVQELANTAWAFATEGQSDVQLFAALARAARRRVSDFNVQSVANTAWAFATWASQKYSYSQRWREQQSDVRAISLCRSLPTQHGRWRLRVSQMHMCLWR